MILKYFLFSLIYCLITKSNIPSLIFILLITISVVLPLKFFLTRNISQYLAIVSFLLIIPLGLPLQIKELILPVGYQYICISLISSLFFLTRILGRKSKISNFSLIINTVTASLAPTSYFSGPSATYQEIIGKSNKHTFLNINSIKNIKLILAISGAFRLSIGFLLASFNIDSIINIFNFSVLIQIENLVYLTLVGFYNFWKYYLLFAGASELCKAFLSGFGINVIDNFKEPELSIFYHEIWNRWHLNITERIRNFLFTPLTLFALRRFPDLNKNLNFILIEAIPIFILFSILAIWHGARKTDFIYAILSSLFFLMSRFLSKQDKFVDLICNNQIFLECFKFINLSLFGGVLIIYDLERNIINSPLTQFPFEEFLPYLILSLLTYLFYRYKFMILNPPNLINIKENKRFSIIFFEIVAIIIINLLIIPEIRGLNNFIYFTQ